MMRAGGVSPSFTHLRAICNYPDYRFPGWLDRVLAAAGVAGSSIRSSSGSDTDATSDSTTMRVKSQTRGALASIAPPARPSVRADTLAELGISYAVLPPRKRRSPAASAPSISSPKTGVSMTVLLDSPGIVASATVAGEEEGEAFAPGRMKARGLVGEVSRGLEVLDLYCGTGGFALNAAKNGARSAWGVRNCKDHVQYPQ